MLNVSSQAAIRSYEKVSDGITFSLDKGLMKVKICLDNMVEVKFTNLQLFLDKPSLVVTNEWKNTPAFSVSDNATEITITTAKVMVIVNLITNALKFTDLNGNVILSESESQNKTMTAASPGNIDRK